MAAPHFARDFEAGNLKRGHPIQPPPQTDHQQPPGERTAEIL